MKRFGEFTVLDNVSFTVCANEFLCILGPSGCGKTTMLNIMAGLLTPTDGQVLVDGEPVSPRKHNISLVFQEPSCLPWRTVRDNVRMGLDIKREVLKHDMTDDLINDKVARIIDLAGLKGFESYYPNQISSGMKQRVAIARAFATEPDLLLMDEPFGFLDIQTKKNMETETLEIWQKLKRTVVLVTHDVEEAVYLAERTIVLSRPPTHIQDCIPIHLSRPRDYTDDGFIKIRKHLTRVIM